MASRAKISGAEAFGSLPGISQGVYCHGSAIIIAPPDRLSMENFRHKLLNQFREIDYLYAGASALPGGLGVVVRIAALNARDLNLALDVATKSARVQLWVSHLLSSARGLLEEQVLELLAERPMMTLPRIFIIVYACGTKSKYGRNSWQSRNEL
jgi:hypothetical protein